jgi:hypothetical protein
MSFDRGRVERQRDGIFAKLGQRFKDCAPSSALDAVDGSSTWRASAIGLVAGEVTTIRRRSICKR